jgi:hypothetical protein
VDHFHARFSGIAIVSPLVVPRRFSEQVEREQVTGGERREWFIVSEEKDGRFTKSVQRKRKTKSARKAPGAGYTFSPPQKRIVRSKSKQDNSFTPSAHGDVSALPSAPVAVASYNGKPLPDVILELTLERQYLMVALSRALHFYDRVAGNVRGDHGWTAGDVLDLKEIRKLACPERREG